MPLFQLSPMMYHAAIYRLVEELEPADLPAVGQQLEEAVRRLHSTAKGDWDDKAYEVGFFHTQQSLEFLQTSAAYLAVCSTHTHNQKSCHLPP